MNNSIKILSKISNPLLKVRNTYTTKAEYFISKNALLLPQQQRNESSIVSKKLSIHSTPSTLLKKKLFIVKYAQI